MKRAREAGSEQERPPVVLQAAGRGAKAPVRRWGEEAQYSVVGWMGLVLVLAALSDYALALYPLGFGSPEWEMATIGALMQGLPLFTIGMAAVWVSAGGRGRRWLLAVVGWCGIGLALCVFGLLAVFVTDIPLGLRATQGVARLGIEKLVAKTLFLGVLFGVSYVLAGVLALKQTRTT